METYGRLTGEQPRPENYQVGPFRLDKTSEVVGTSMEDFWSMGGRLEGKVGNPLKREADLQME